MSSSARDLFLNLLVTKQEVTALGRQTHSAFWDRREHSHWLSTGRVRNGAEPLSVLFRGSEQRLGELEALLFDAAPTERRRLAEPHAQTADLYAETAWPWQYSSGATHVVQAWVDAVCVPRDADQHLTKGINDGVRRTLKRASQARHRQTASTSKDDAAHFYRELFEPMAQERFGAMVSYGSLDVFLAMNGRTMATEVVFLERDGERIAGVAFLVSPPRRTLRVWAYGIRRDLLADARLRAELMALLNAEAVRRAAAQGFTLNLGLTRPYADDGVAVYKRRWGAEFVPSDGTRFALRFVSDEVQRRLLRVAPLLEITRDGVRALPQPPEQSASPEVSTAARLSWEG